MTVLTGAPLLPTYARFPVTFVDGEGSLADRRRRPALPRPRRRDRRRRRSGTAIPAPLEAAHAQLDRLWHVSNLYSTEPMEELATRLSDRFGGAHAFFCNSGAEAIEAAIKWARKVDRPHRARRARGLVPRPHDGRARRSPASRRSARRSSRCSPACASRRRTTLADARSGPTRPRSSSSRSRARAACTPLPAETLAAGARARRRARRDAGLRRGADRHRPHRRVLRVAAARRPARRASRSRRGSPTGCRSARCSSPTTRRRASCPATTPRRSAATRSRAPRPCAVVDAIDDELLAHVRDDRRALRERRFDDVRGAGLLLAIELDRPAGPVALAALEHGLLVGTAGEHGAAPHAAADDLGRREPTCAIEHPPARCSQ